MNYMWFLKVAAVAIAAVAIVNRTPLKGIVNGQ